MAPDTPPLETPQLETLLLETLLLSDAGAVRHITMNRPDALNALSTAMMDDLADAFGDAAGNDSIKVVVLTGAGRAFSAGADLSEMGGPPRQQRHGLNGMIDAIIDFPKPLLVAVNGLGVGYGATVCGLADYVIMADSARLRAPFSALGITAELASTYTFPQLMGHQRASWFLLAAEWMPADECLDVGLAAEVVPADELAAIVAERAATLAALPLASLVTTKRLLREPHLEAMKASVRAENRALGELTGGPANREALAAFLEKRPPDFTGR